MKTNTYKTVLTASLVCVLTTCLQSKAEYVAYGDSFVQGGDPVSTGELNDTWSGWATSSAGGSASYSAGHVSITGYVDCQTGGATVLGYQNGLNGGTGGATQNTVYVDSCGFYWEGDSSAVSSVTVQTGLNISGTLEAGAWIWGQQLDKVFFWTGIARGSASFQTGGDVSSWVGGSIDGSQPVDESGLPATYLESYSSEYGWHQKVVFSINDSLEYSIEGCPGSITISPQMWAESYCFITVMSTDNVDWEDINAYAVGNASISGTVTISTLY